MVKHVGTHRQCFQMEMGVIEKGNLCSFVCRFPKNKTRALHKIALNIRFYDLNMYVYKMERNNNYNYNIVICMKK